MNAQDLKNSILQLAIQGKLVEQREEEGTGEELLEKILVEKKRLIKIGELKKEKDLKEVTNDEIVFNVPQNWKWTRLANISNMYTGNSIPKSIKENKYSKVNNGYQYVTTKDIGFDHTIQYENGVIIPYEEEKFRTSHRDSILMCIEGGSAGKKIGILNKTVCFGNKLCSFNLIMGDPRYLYYYLQSPLFSQAFKDEMTGIIGGVSIVKLKSIVIPLPSLEEQKRIVAKIEELMSYVDKYDKAYSEVVKLNKKFPDDMQKSILQYAIHGKLVEQREEEGTAEELYEQIQEEKKKLIEEGKIKKTKALPEITHDEIPFDIPESWKWVRLGEIAWYLDAGKSPNCQNINVMGDEWGVITTTAIQINFFDQTQNKILPANFNVKRDIQVRNGDVLITRAGPTNRTGVACLVQDIDYNLILSDKIVRINLSENYLDKRFITQAINSPSIRNYIINMMSGMDKQQVNISQDKIRKILIPLAPLNEQKRIVEKIEDLSPYTKQLIK